VARRRGSRRSSPTATPTRSWSTENSRLLAEHLPNAQLRIYPGAGHGFLDQYPEQFGDHVRAFLNGG
jgi:pimeloyl-ACP methyl ester carboxylesterase